MLCAHKAKHATDPKWWTDFVDTVFSSTYSIRHISPAPPIWEAPSKRRTRQPLFPIGQFFFQFPQRLAAGQREIHAQKVVNAQIEFGVAAGLGGRGWHQYTVGVQVHQAVVVDRQRQFGPKRSHVFPPR